MNPNKAISRILSLTQDPYPVPDYRVCRSSAEFDDYIPSDWFLGDVDGLYNGGYLACDTESLPGGSPYCVTYSHTPGTGRLIYVDDSASMKRFLNLLRTCRIHLLFHNYLHDRTVFDLLRIPIGPFTDTMVRAYNLCLGGGGDDESESRAGRGSLGLKVLAYRLCNMRMRSFKETVYPHSIPHLLSWLTTARETFAPSEPIPVCVCGHESRLHEVKGKLGRNSGACVLCDCKRHKKGKPELEENHKLYGLLHRKIGNLIKSLEANEAPTEWDPVDEEDDPIDPYNLIDPWQRIRKWHDHDHRFLEEFLPPYPLPSIAHVPEPELLHYACRDADATLRIFLHMQTLNPWVFW